MTSVLEDTPTVKRANKLLTEAARLKKLKDDCESSLEEIKVELAATVMARDLPGLRWGAIGFRCGGYVKRKSFSQDKAKALMLEYEVPPEKVGECYTESAEFLDMRLVDLLV